MLFQPPQEELPDEEIAAVLRQSIACAGRLSRHADVSLAGVCAEHLVDGLRAAGLIVAQPKFDADMVPCLRGRDPGLRAGATPSTARIST